MPQGKPNQPHNNPYAAAAGAYGTNAQKNSADPREVEARVLLKSAQFMQDLQNDWSNVNSDLLGETLKYNRSVWMMFYDTALENPEGNRPNDLRSNIVNLANFIFKREIDIMAKPEKGKLDVLIRINRDIAGGLMKGASADAAEKNARQDAADETQKAQNPSGSNTDHSA